MKNRSRVIPSPGPPEVGGIVGGDVYGSQHHEDGTTITTGDVLEVRPGQIVTRHHETTVVYDLGKSMWEDEAVKKAYESDPVVRRTLG